MIIARIGNPAVLLRLAVQCLCLTFLVGTAPPARAQDDDEEEESMDAVERIDATEPLALDEAIRRIAARDFSMAYRMLRNVYLHSGDAVERALARFHLAVIDREEGNFSGGRNGFREVAEMPATPDEWRAESLLGEADIFWLEGDTSYVGVYREALDTPGAASHQVGRAALRLGRHYAEREEDGEARRYLEQVIALGREAGAAGAEAAYHLALVEQRAARKDRAASLWEAVRGDAQAPAHIRANALLRLTEQAEAAGRTDQAERLLREVRDDTALPYPHRIRAETLLSDDRAATAGEAAIKVEFSLLAESLARLAQPAVSGTGEGFRWRSERLHARPGDRWVDLFLDFDTDQKTGQDLVAELFDRRSGQSLTRTEHPVRGNTARLRLDLPRAGGAHARLRLALRRDGRELAGDEVLVRQDPAVLPLQPGERITLRIDAPENADLPESWPVALGVPFAPGELWDPGMLRALDAAGREIPSQYEITARWGDGGSARWVRWDILVDPRTDRVTLEAAPRTARSIPPVPLRVTRDDRGLLLDTGAARYGLDGAISPVRYIEHDGRRVVTAEEGLGLYVIDQRGRLGHARNDDVVIEAAGPVAAAIRFEGDYVTEDGEVLARHITRVEAAAGQTAARATHTLVLVRDSNEVWFRDIGWDFAVEPGAGPQARLALDRADPTVYHTESLTPAHPAAFVLQESHYRFYAGENRFSVQRLDDSGSSEILATGEEMGDWALLQGDEAGFLAVCRESARQHPKEFEVRANRLLLRLFSPRTGEELDFRIPTLIEKWNLEQWYPQRFMPRVRAFHSNAIGWSKTHELLLAPLPPAAGATEAARLARLLTFPVYLHNDPHWIRRSGAMGPLYPKTPELFPEEETLIERGMAGRFPGGHEAGGRYGFVDYYHGPGYSVSIGSTRYNNSYTQHTDFWVVYARAGERRLREFAEGTNKAYLDNYLAHWDGPQKIRGLYTAGGSVFPAHWGDRTTMTVASTTNLNQFDWLYHLAGYRRAGDAMRQFGEGLVQAWLRKEDTADVFRQRHWIGTGRVIMALRTLVQTYPASYDPALRFILEDAARELHDPLTSMQIIKGRTRPELWSSYYKVNEDVQSLVEAWQLLGTPRYEAMARGVGQWVWEENFARFPIGRKAGHTGLLANFLYAFSPDGSIPAVMDYMLRRAATAYDADSDQPLPMGASSTTFVFQGIPYAMNLLVDEQGRRRDLYRWIAYNDYGSDEAAFIVRKDRRYPLKAYLQANTDGRIGGQVRVRQLGRTIAGSHQVSVTEQQRGLTSVRWPKEAPGAAYRIESTARGEHTAVLDSDAPMVLHAPSYWRLPAVRPAADVYFKLFPGDQEPALLVEGGGHLTDPEGHPWPGPDPVRGWVSLPADRPGLWRLRPLENRLVRAVNFPPVFALNRPENYFLPDIEWSGGQTIPSGPRPPAEPGDVFTTGREPDIRGLYLAGNRELTFAGGAPHPSGDGTLYLPWQQGTVEFFFRPDWGTFDLGEGNVSKRLVRMQTDQGIWELVYRLDPQGTRINLGPRDPSHSLFAHHWTRRTEDGRRTQLRAWALRTLFEPGEWVHIAWTWGPSTVYSGTRVYEQVPSMRLFVNGDAQGHTLVYTAAGSVPEGIPQTLSMGHDLRALIRGLRISDIERYTERFTPPAAEILPAVDAHTRALFPLENDFGGYTATPAPPPVAQLKP